MNLTEANKKISLLPYNLQQAVKKSFDGELTGILGRFSLDLLKLDQQLQIVDPEYDPDKSTYKGKKKYSTSRYIKEKYGKEAHDIVLEFV